jgi:pyruvate kinase
MVLYREVYPLLMAQQHTDRDRCWPKPSILIERGVVDKGDLIVLTIGEPIGAPAAPTPEDRPRRRAPNPLN